jgi:hypothetical protein
MRPTCRTLLLTRWQTQTDCTQRAQNEQMDQMMSRLVSGIGQVCISASMLEWALTYLTGMANDWDHARMIAVISKSGEPMREFRKVVPQLEIPGLDAARFLADAERLLRERNRVVHSVMMLETEVAGQFLYEAWHPKSDIMKPVDPDDLNTLALDLSQCAAEAGAFADALQEAAERESAS